MLVIELVVGARNLTADGSSTTMLALALTVVQLSYLIAWVSYRLVEEPARARAKAVAARISGGGRGCGYSRPPWV